MITIHKYELVLIDEQTVDMPRGAQILTIDTQCGIPCLWARVNTDNPMERRTIFIHGTGHELTPMTGKYINTFQLAQGNLIFHAFEWGVNDGRDY